MKTSIAELLFVGGEHRPETAWLQSHAARVRAWPNDKRVAAIAREVLETCRALVVLVDTTHRLTGKGLQEDWEAFILERRDSLILLLDSEPTVVTGEKLFGKAN